MTTVPAAEQPAAEQQAAHQQAAEQQAAEREPRILDERTARRRRPRTFRRTGVLDIQSKLLVMLLAVSVLAALVVGAVGYLNARASLQDAAFARMTALRQSRLTSIDRSFGQFTNGVVAATRNDSAIGATKAFEAGWKDLQSKTPSAAQRQQVDDWYRNTLIPQLDHDTGETADADQFEPTTDPQTYLQANYTAPYTDYDRALANDDAGDGSTWSAAHAEYHD